MSFTIDSDVVETDKIKAYEDDSGNIILEDKVNKNQITLNEDVTMADVASHLITGDNPHATSLEQARSEDNQLSGPVDAGGNDITAVGALGADSIAPLKLGILPDIHWGSTSRNDSDAETKAALDPFIDKMNEWGADFVIQTGDFTETSSFSEDLQNIIDAREYVENTGGAAGTGLDAPIEYTLGNHEYKNQSEGDMADIYDAFGFGTTLGDTFTAYEINGWKIIQFNSAYTTTEDANGTGDAHVPDSSDPFDGISWLKGELNTDKPIITHTHYGLNNSWGDPYRTTGNAFKALKELTEADRVVSNIHGHAHANRDWDCGKQSIGPFGMPFYNAGHIAKGKDRWYTYSDPPTSVYAYGYFYHPQKYQIENTLNTLDRANFAVDGGANVEKMHPRTTLRGAGMSQYFNIGETTRTFENVSGSGSFSQDARFNRLILETGTTAGSVAGVGFSKGTVGEAWGVLEGFKVRMRMDLISAGEDYALRMGRGAVRNGGGAGVADGNYYGFKLENGNLRGVVSKNGTETTTQVLTTVGQGSNFNLSAMLFSPHICRFYYRTSANWERGEITDDGVMPVGGRDLNRLAQFSIGDNNNENYRAHLHDYKFWKMGE